MLAAMKLTLCYYPIPAPSTLKYNQLIIIEINTDVNGVNDQKPKIVFSFHQTKLDWFDNHNQSNSLLLVDCEPLTFKHLTIHWTAINPSNQQLVHLASVIFRTRPIHSRTHD